MITTATDRGGDGEGGGAASETSRAAEAEVRGGGHHVRLRGRCIRESIPSVVTPPPSIACGLNEPLILFAEKEAEIHRGVVAPEQPFIRSMRGFLATLSYDAAMFSHKPVRRYEFPC